ncbi:MAG: low temperature requirement protein A [Actinomycetota bacterium]
MQSADDAKRSDKAHIPPVAPLELFFDLVFVFVLSQITHLIEEDLTPEGIARGLLLFLLLWTSWVAFAWVGNAHRAEDYSEGGIPRRLIIIGAMALLIALGMLVSDASESMLLPGALIYLCLFALYVADYVIATTGDPMMRRNIIRMTAIQALLPLSVVAVALLSPGPWGVIIVGICLVAAYLSPFTTDDGAWQFSAAHADERFSLLMLIVLGESLISIGLGAADDTFGWPVVGAIVLGVLIVASLWWQYFDVVAHQGAAYIQNLPLHKRVIAARVVYTYLHVFLVIGVILMALGLKAASADPLDPLPLTEAILLPGGIALFLVTLAVIRFIMRRRILWPLPAAAVLILLVIPLALAVPALAAELACVVILAVLVAAREIYTRRGVIERIH